MIDRPAHGGYPTPLGDSDRDLARAWHDAHADAEPRDNPSAMKPGIEIRFNPATFAPSAPIKRGPEFWRSLPPPHHALGRSGNREAFIAAHGGPHAAEDFEAWWQAHGIDCVTEEAWAAYERGEGPPPPNSCVWPMIDVAAQADAIARAHAEARRLHPRGCRPTLRDRVRGWFGR